MHKLYMMIAIGFGAGRAPAAPGTFGTLAGVLPVMLTIGMPYWMRAAVFAVLFFAGMAASHYHGSHTGIKDASEVVIDEIAAYYMIFLFIPANVVTVVAGFVLFRIFDILKPWPIRHFESFDGGMGVMLDDIMAAVYSTLCLAVFYLGYIMFFAHRA